MSYLTIISNFSQCHFADQYQMFNDYLFIYLYIKLLVHLFIHLFMYLYLCVSGDYGGTPGLGLLRLHSTFRHDLKIYASDEGRVQMTAAAFAKVSQEVNPYAAAG